MRKHTFQNPIVFVVVHVYYTDLQVRVAVFENEEDAVTAALAIVQERAHVYGYSEEVAKLTESIGEWHTMTRFHERIEILQSPVNVLQFKGANNE